MTTTQTYQGGCHCGAVRYEVDLELGDVIACNCSICSKTGWLLAFAPASAFRCSTPQSNLGDYQFAKKHIHHEFCRTCGVRSFGWGLDGDGNKMVSVNVRCLDGVDVSTLAITHYDGASL
ncbi:MAG: GFA family protein [Myxococcota bacterium]